MKLSILICSIPSRREFLQKMVKSLVDQYSFTDNITTKENKFSLTKISSKDVEIVICIDNKQMTVGAKRNLLMDESVSEYFVFVDDDDRITDDYIISLLAGIRDNKDVILFDVACSINGRKAKKVVYDANYTTDRNLTNQYLRIPNHIMCWKRDIVTERFPDISMGEDVGWARKMKPHIKSQSRITKILYYYDFNHRTTETQ